RLCDFVKCENLALRFTDRPEWRKLFSNAENVRRQTGIRFRARLVIDGRRRRNLFLYILRVDHPIKLFNVLDESLDNLRIKRAADHAAQKRERLLAFHSFAIRTIATRRIVEINHRNNPCDEWNPFTFETFWITAAI